MSPRTTYHFESGRLTVRRPGHCPATLVLTALVIGVLTLAFGCILYAGLQPGDPGAERPGTLVAIIFGSSGLVVLATFAWMQMRLHSPFACEVADGVVTVRNGIYRHRSNFQPGEAILELRVCKGRSSWWVTGHLLVGRRAELIIPWKFHGNRADAEQAAATLAAQASETELFPAEVRDFKLSVADLLQDMGLPWQNKKSRLP